MLMFDRSSFIGLKENVMVYFLYHVIFCKINTYVIFALCKDVRYTRFNVLINAFLYILGGNA